MSNRYLTINEICETLRISRATFYRMRKSDPRFPQPLYIRKNSPRFVEAEIESFINLLTQEATSNEGAA